MQWLKWKDWSSHLKKAFKRHIAKGNWLKTDSWVTVGVYHKRHVCWLWVNWGWEVGSICIARSWFTFQSILHQSIVCYSCSWFWCNRDLSITTKTLVEPLCRARFSPYSHCEFSMSLGQLLWLRCHQNSMCKTDKISHLHTQRHTHIHPHTQRWLPLLKLMFWHVQRRGKALRSCSIIADNVCFTPPYASADKPTTDWCVTSERADH